jgi:hypothetical protein
MVELSDFKGFILPSDDKMFTAITDSLNYHLDTTKGRTGLHVVHSFLTAAGIDATSFPTEAALTIDGPEGVVAIAMDTEVATFTDTRKVVLSFTPPFPSTTGLRHQS